MNMRPALRKALRWFGYPLFFLGWFILFCYWLFPYDRVRDYLVQEVERPMSLGGTRAPSGIRLEIQSLRPSWWTGVEAEGVRVSKTREDPAAAPLALSLDRARARISLLSLIAGDLDMSFGVDVAGGEIEGEFAQNDDVQRVACTFSDVDLARWGVIRDTLGIPVQGVLEGTLNATISPRQAETVGASRLTIRGLTVGDGRAKLKLESLGLSDGLTVERIEFGDMHFDFDMADGAATLTRAGASGRDVDLELTGTVHVTSPVRGSRLDMIAALKFNDTYRNRNDRTRGLFALIDLAPQISAAKAPDGTLQFRLEGTPGSTIRYSPAGSLPRSRRRGG